LLRRDSNVKINSLDYSAANQHVFAWYKNVLRCITTEEEEKKCGTKKSEKAEKSVSFF
jgi:hypothetical protein